MNSSQNLKRNSNQFVNKQWKKYSNYSNPKANKWWSKDLTQARNGVNNARRRFQRCQSERSALRDEYLSKIHIYKKFINNQKSWNEFVSESTRENPWGLIYQISKEKLNIEKINKIQTQDGSLKTDSIGIAQALIKIFS
jgi:hypothetical protein